jgi:release factor glutamine methyltransferase
VTPTPSGDGARTVGTLVAEVTERLTAAGVPTPRVDAELLLAHCTGRSRARLRLEPEGVPAPEVAAALEALVGRRVAREPLQLIIGSVGFRYIDVLVRPGVFIPRPETETLAGEAIARLHTGAVVIEPCTGTGAVACALASEVPGLRAIATDTSATAVALAEENAVRCAVDVEVRHGDLLAPVTPQLRGRVDVVVSNPPYVASGELVGLEPEVVDWDPRDALVSGDTGHEISDRLIAESTGWLRPGGWLLMEVDAGRAAEAVRRCAAAGYIETAVVADLTGRDRIVTARTPG